MPKSKLKPMVISSLRSANGTPVLPPVGLRHAPTMQSGTIRDFNAEFKRRNEAMLREVLKLIRDNLIVDERGYATNAASKKRYKYLVSLDGIMSLIDQVKAAISRNYLDDFTSFKEGFWSDKYIRKAFDSGVRDAVQSALSVTRESTAGTELASVLMQTQSAELAYRQDRSLRSGLVAGRLFEEMKGLTDVTRKELANELSSGIERGAGIVEISKKIMDRAGVSGSRAARIARTEVNNAYRNASYAETRRLNDTVYKGTDFELRYLWFSALAETTRYWHAERHGNVYTVDEVVEFYEVGANAINCYCSQTPVLYNKKTGVLLQQDLADKMVEQRKMFVKKAA